MKLSCMFPLSLSPFQASAGSSALHLAADSERVSRATNSHSPGLFLLQLFSFILQQDAAVNT